MSRIAINISNLIYSIMKLFPIKDRVVFVSRQYNEKSIDFRIIEAELAIESPNTELVFLCKKVPDNYIGKIQYAFHILKQMKYISRSRAVVLDTYCFTVSALKQRKELVILQMWHAMGSLKKFGWSIVGTGEGRSLKTAKGLYMHRNYSYYTVSSENCVQAFDEAYGYNDGGPNFDGLNHAIVAPLPRTKLYTDKSYVLESRKKVKEAYPELNKGKVIVYAPTFRKEADMSAEIEKVVKHLEGYNVVVKKHPLMEVKCPSAIVDDKFTTFEMMCAADCILLDYSAVVFEACLLNKPMVFYTPDYEKYMEERNFYIDYEKSMPGVIVKDISQLRTAVENCSDHIVAIEDFQKKWVDLNGTDIIDILK